MGIVYGQGLLVAFLSLKFQTTGIPSNSAAWQAMSLALPATLSMKSLLNDSPDVNFWLKYWPRVQKAIVDLLVCFLSLFFTLEQGRLHLLLWS